MCDFRFYDSAMPEHIFLQTSRSRIDFAKNGKRLAKLQVAKVVSAEVRPSTLRQYEQQFNSYGYGASRRSDAAGGCIL